MRQSIPTHSNNQLQPTSFSKGKGSLMKNKWEQVSGKWKQFGPEARKKWDQLSDEDITRTAGNHSTLSSMIQKKYKITRKEADKQLEVWANSLKV
jgi:uncharacterized protein YjbJ (UPF0337 family)